MILDALIGRNGFTVGFLWRFLGVALAGTLVVLSATNGSVRQAIYQIDTSIIDRWQRLSSPDEPSGEVVVVGVDAAAIDAFGRWPWSRDDLAKLVNAIADAGPKSISLDILLTEPGAYSQQRLFRVFRQNTPDVMSLLQVDPDAALVNALGRAPAAIAVAGGARGRIDPDNQLAQCMDEGKKDSDLGRPYQVECLLFPQPLFWDVAGEAVTSADHDLDGVVRRSRALVAQLLTDPNTGEDIELFFASFPVATLTACADTAGDCTSLALNPADITTDVDTWAGFELPWAVASGEEPPAPTPLTPSFSFWLDFGAQPALGAHFGDGPKPPNSTVSAFDLMYGEVAAAERLAGRHVMVGMTRIGDIDRHTTPLVAESGVPGVVIQALAADNILTGRALSQPVWTGLAGLVLSGVVILLVLFRFGVTSLAAMSAIVLFLIALPFAYSWFAFEFQKQVVFAALPGLAAFLAGSPVLYGRVSSLRRDLADAKEDAIDQAARMGVLHDMQIGSLPFEADFTDQGIETASICRPSKEVGGDFFELLTLQDGRILGAVGDVMGKDVHASLVSVISKTISGSVTNRTPGPLGAAFSEISQEFLRLAPGNWLANQGGFVTLVAARIDPATGEAEFATAGADTPIVVTKEGEIRDLELPSVAPFGWIDKPSFETGRLTLNPGDSVIMFTDGVTEAPEPTDDDAPPTGNIEFGYARAQSAASDAAPDGAAAIINLLDSRITEHLAGGDPIDDTTILVMTYLGPPANAS